MSAVPLVAITLLGAALRLWSFDEVPGNPFYDAATRSMAMSWHNFFFGAFEPGAQVSIDKAPVDLWLQVAGVKVFGFTGVAARLPEVAAGILAIPLLYALVRRLFGRTAGLGAAAAMAVLPASILTAHSDTMDSVMMLLDLLAAWLVVVGAQSRRAWPVVAAGAVLGLAFNIKLFQALIIAPSLVLLMLLAVDLPVRRRIAVFAGSLAAFGVVSLSWVATASLTPLSNRPWPIGSANGSVWDVIFVFNGIDRLRGSASPAALKLDPPGALRFFGGAQDYVATVGTILMAAVVFGAAALVAGVFARRRAARPDRLRVAGGVFLATWLVSGVALLSHMQRMQPRYLEAVTPAIAAVLGVGVARLAAAASSRLTAAALTVASAGLAATGILLTHAAAWAVVLAIAATVCCGLVAVAPDARGGAGALAVCALAAALAVPASAAVRVAAQHRSNAGLPSRLSPDRLATLSTFLRAHQSGAKYELVSPTVARAAPLIARDGRPVLMLTSLYGRPLIGPRRLRHLVATGQARYALLGARACTASAVPACASALRWALTHSVDVGADASLPRGMLYRLTTTPTHPKAATVHHRKAR